MMSRTRLCHRPWCWGGSWCWGWTGASGASRLFLQFSRGGPAPGRVESPGYSPASCGNEPEFGRGRAVGPPTGPLVLLVGELGLWESAPSRETLGPCQPNSLAPPRPARAARRRPAARKNLRRGQRPPASTGTLSGWRGAPAAAWPARRLSPSCRRPPDARTRRTCCCACITTELLGMRWLPQVPPCWTSAANWSTEVAPSRCPDVAAVVAAS
jgi:hypothetical protein